MSDKSVFSSTFAMDGFERPVVALANSSTRVLAPHVRQVPVVSAVTSSHNGTGEITLGQLAQAKPGGIK